MGRRNVIQHQIRHQPAPLRKRGEITPIAMARLELFVARHRKPAITGGFEKGQHMNHRRERPQMAIHQLTQALQSRLALLNNRVGIGDQHGIPAAPSLVVQGLIGIP